MIYVKIYLKDGSYHEGALMMCGVDGGYFWCMLLGDTFTVMADEISSITMTVEK